MNTTKRIKELAEFLNCDKDEISVSTYDDTLFIYGNQEYLVLTDTEADTVAENYIKDSLWAFRAEFIIDECNLNPECTDAIRVMQERCCESCNSLILAIIEGSCGIDVLCMMQLIPMEEATTSLNMMGMRTKPITIIFTELTNKYSHTKGI